MTPGNGFNSNRGVFGNVSQQETVLCVAYGNNAESCFSAGNSGLIHCWGNNILLKVIQGHQGPVFSMYSSDDILKSAFREMQSLFSTYLYGMLNIKEQLTFVTGGKDGTVITWTNQFVDRHHVVVIDSSTFNGNHNKHNLASSSNRTSVQSNTRCIKSAVIGGNGSLLLVGTKESEVVELNISSNQIHIIEQGHGEGEMWGLATHPNKMYFATVSDDCTLRLWSVGASGPTLALMKYLDRPSRCIAFSSDGGLLVAGMTDGSFVIFNSTTLTEKMKVHKRKQNISDMKFSPDPGAYLAVASHDNFVDIYNASTCQLVGVCKGASSYVTHLDWNDDGSVLQVNTGAREHLFYQAPRGNRITPTLTDIENFVWSTFTGVLGPMCAGIWSPYSDVTDVNSSSLTRDKRYLVTGDDLGLVKLFNFPAKLKNNKHKRYMGHSAHVTNVRWMCDGRTLISIGGDDASILIWKLIGGPEQVQLEPVAGRENRSMNGVTNEPGRSAKAIQSEDSNSDGSDEGEDNIPGGYDSDVEREAKIDYVPKFNIDPLRDKQVASNVGSGENDGGGGGDNGGGIALNKENTVVDSVKFLFSRRIENKNFSTPEKNDLKIDSNEIKGLQLKLVYGYRGMDTRNNLHYLDHAGAEIVYHTAATVVVVDVATGCQRFYLGHSDDIISLATNQNPRYKGIVATGDIGQRPTIHVWHSKTMSTNSVLSGVLKGGVVSVDFSCGGKLLVAVGLDEEHTIVVYNWVEGMRCLRIWIFGLGSKPRNPKSFGFTKYNAIDSVKP
ncbi:hypothetical protein HELRODRAFT_181950 [Helobdella robusta]|uniref:EML-like second beta-propeller domain-containing protein n=1 Tax=Helobdella robusta TaxID=6412 RepID=T1FHH9_HELRO|nr:hypothetical protein HELRODRAFT_181950 [Helobdella robusta]ESN91894.1 hypothetical protein HELRODRAFT_181950 [Helobdella robusta]